MSWSSPPVAADGTADVRSQHQSCVAQHPDHLPGQGCAPANQAKQHAEAVPLKQIHLQQSYSEAGQTQGSSHMSSDHHPQTQQQQDVMEPAGTHVTNLSDHDATVQLAPAVLSPVAVAQLEAQPLLQPEIPVEPGSPEANRTPPSHHSLVVDVSIPGHVEPRNDKSCTESAPVEDRDASQQDGSATKQTCAKQLAGVLVIRPARWVWSNGYACGAGCQLIFSWAALFVKLMGDRVPLLEFTAHRSLISWLLTIIVASRVRLTPVYGHRQNLPLLILRGALQAVSMVTYYGAMYLLPLADAVVIGLLHPPLTALLSWPILKEPLGWRGWLGCTLALSGVVVLAQPPFLFGHYGSGSCEDGSEGCEDTGASHQRSLGIVIGVISATCQAATNIVYKFISNREPALVLSLWFHVITFIFSIIPACVGWPQPPVLPGLLDHTLLLGIAGCSFGGHLLMSRAFQLLPAATAAMFAFTVVGWAYLYGATLFHDPITLLGLLGTLLISGGVASVISRSLTGSRKANTSGSTGASAGAAKQQACSDSKAGDNKGSTELSSSATGAARLNDDTCDDSSLLLPKHQAPSDSDADAWHSRESGAQVVLTPKGGLRKLTSFKGWAHFPGWGMSMRFGTATGTYGGWGAVSSPRRAPLGLQGAWQQDSEQEQGQGQGSKPDAVP